MKTTIVTLMAIIALLGSFLGFFSVVYAQEDLEISPLTINESTSTGSSTLSGPLSPDRAAILPEEEQITPSIFEQRSVLNYTNPLNIFAYVVQSSVRLGIPTETIALILLIPFLATFIAFVRNVIGLQSLDMLVPITFSIALLASNLTIGLLLLLIIVFSSIIARVLLKKVRIMQLPKIALSIIVVSLSLLVFLILVARFDLIAVKDISIVPILLIILLSERIVQLQFEQAFNRELGIVVVTLLLGVVGYMMFSLQLVRETILLYPEIVFLLIPINMLIGRYFGLRLVERFRFKHIGEEEE